MYQIYEGTENISNKISKAFLSNARQIGVILQFPDFELTDEEVIKCDIEEGIISSSKFAFGTANVAVASIKVYNANDKLTAIELEKNEVRIFYTIKIEDKTYKVPMGLYVVDTVKEDDNKVISIDAYDKLILSEENYNLNTELTYPVTLKGIVEDACKIAKINYIGEDFFNSGLLLNDMVVFGADCSCRDILQNIAELSCTYVNCSKDGNIRFINLNDTTPVLSVNPNHYFKYKKLENPFGPIKSVRIARNEEVELHGEGSPQLQIDDNFFLPTDIKPLPESLYNQIKHITYTPSDLEFQGNPLIEPGDFIEVVDKDGVKHNILVTNIKYTYNGGLRCVIKSAANSDMSLATEKKNIVSESVNGLNKRVNSLYQLIDKKIMQTIMKQQDEFNNRMDGLEKELKEVEMTVTPDGIVNTVTNSKEYQDVVDGIYDGLNGLAGQTVTIESIIAQYANRINMGIKKGNIISEINLDESGVQILGNKIQLNGYVTFTDLQGDGTTIINGNNITTGTLSGDRIYGGTIEAVNFKGDNVDVMAGLSVSPAEDPTKVDVIKYPNPDNPAEWATIKFRQRTINEDRENTFEAVQLNVFPYGDANDIDNSTLPSNPREWNYGLEINGAVRANDNFIIKGEKGLIANKILTKQIDLYSGDGRRGPYCGLSVDGNTEGMNLSLFNKDTFITVKQVFSGDSVAKRQMYFKSTGGYYFDDPDSANKSNFHFDVPAVHLRPSAKYANQSIIMTTGAGNITVPNPVKFLNGEIANMGTVDIDLYSTTDFTGIYAGYLYMPPANGLVERINTIDRRKMLSRIAMVNGEENFYDGEKCDRNGICRTQAIYGDSEYSTNDKSSTIKHVTSHVLTVRGTSGLAEIEIDAVHVKTAKLNTSNQFINYIPSKTENPVYTSSLVPVVSPCGNFKAWWTKRVKIVYSGNKMKFYLEIGYEKPSDTAEDVNIIVYSKTPFDIERKSRW